MKLFPFVIILGILMLSACRPDDDFNVIDDDFTDINDNTDNNDPNSNDPNVNMVNLEELGRLLFWDPILSGEKDVSCATCHHPDFGYADGRALPIGVGGRGLGPQRFDAVADDIGLVGRNAPTIINTAFNGMDENGNFNPELAPMFWDNRAQSLETQALLPLHSFDEMRGHAFGESATLDSIVNRLIANNEYRNLFAEAFGQNNAINSENIGRAIASFERTITATDSPFDRYQAGNENAMTPDQIRGMDRFERVGCMECHSGPMFSDFELHTLGVPDSPLLATTDSGADGTYAFRTPTLRNLSDTGPFFHTGVAENLQQVLEFYREVSRPGGGGPGGGLNINQNVNQNDIARDARDLNINNNDIQSIIAFLQALNDPNFDKRIPNEVPSGLTPGGDVEL